MKVIGFESSIRSKDLHIDRVHLLEAKRIARVNNLINYTKNYKEILKFYKNELCESTTLHHLKEEHITHLAYHLTVEHFVSENHYNIHSVNQGLVRKVEALVHAYDYHSTNAYTYHNNRGFEHIR